MDRCNNMQCNNKKIRSLRTQDIVMFSGGGGCRKYKFPLLAKMVYTAITRCNVTQEKCYRESPFIECLFATFPAATNQDDWRKCH